MHELSLAQGIVEIVCDAARAERFTRVRRVRIAVGALAAVEPDALAFGFEMASRGTVVEGAELSIERPPGAGYCLGCSAEVKLAERGEPCPACGSHRVMVSGGEDLRVIDLEVE